MLIRNKSFPVAILCSDKRFQGAVPARKKEWVTPKMSPMDARCTDGGKPYGNPNEAQGTSETPQGEKTDIIVGTS